MLRPEYLAQKLTPYPLPTKDGGVLRTLGDAHAYIMALPKKRALRAHWQHAGRLLLQQASAAALTRQVQVALFRPLNKSSQKYSRAAIARQVMATLAIPEREIS